MTGVVATLLVDEARMRAAATTGFTTATAVADALVERGVPFREAHHVVGALVARAEAAGVELTGLADGGHPRRPSPRPRTTVAAGLAQACRPSPDALRAAAELESALARPDVIGGTAPADACRPSWRRPRGGSGIGG